MTDQLTEAREAFGRALGRWFAMNAWPQSITEAWAKAVGNQIGPWSSQISPCMRGIILPKPQFFFALAQFNQFVFEKKDLNKLTDRVLRDRISNGEALCHEDGRPFDATDFYGLFVGIVKAPDIKDPPRRVTQADADDCGKINSQAFKDFGMHRMLSPVDAWALLVEEMTRLGCSAEDQEAIREVVTGWKPATIEFVEHLFLAYGGTCPFMEALENLGEAGEMVQLLRKQMREYSVQA